MCGVMEWEAGSRARERAHCIDKKEWEVTRGQCGGGQSEEWETLIVF